MKTTNKLVKCLSMICLSGAIGFASVSLAKRNGKKSEESKDKKEAAATETPEQMKAKKTKMIEMHQAMIDCLKTDKSPADCHHETHQKMMENGGGESMCPMMGKEGHKCEMDHGHGNHHGKGHGDHHGHDDNKKDDEHSENKD